jgi:hypothetical protein
MIPKSGYRFPACAKPCQPLVSSFDASAGEGRSEKIMLKQQAKAKQRINLKSFRFSTARRSPRWNLATHRCPELRRGPAPPVVVPARRALARQELAGHRFEPLPPSPQAPPWRLAWTGREQ